MQKRLKRKRKLAAKLKWLLVTPIAFAVMGASECSTLSSNVPDFDWHPKVYTGSSQAASIIRQQTMNKAEVIEVTSPEFDKMGCTYLEEFANAKQAYFNIVNKCKEWKRRGSDE